MFHAVPLATRRQKNSGWRAAFRAGAYGHGQRVRVSGPERNGVFHRYSLHSRTAASSSALYGLHAKCKRAELARINHKRLSGRSGALDRVWGDLSRAVPECGQNPSLLSLKREWARVANAVLATHMLSGMPADVNENGLSRKLPGGGEVGSLGSDGSIAGLHVSASRNSKRRK